MSLKDTVLKWNGSQETSAHIHVYIKEMVRLAQASLKALLRS